MSSEDDLEFASDVGYQCSFCRPITGAPPPSISLQAVLLDETIHYSKLSNNCCFLFKVNLKQTLGDKELCSEMMDWDDGLAPSKSRRAARRDALDGVSLTRPGFDRFTRVQRRLDEMRTAQKAAQAAADALMTPKAEAASLLPSKSRPSFNRSVSNPGSALGASSTSAIGLPLPLPAAIPSLLSPAESTQTQQSINAALAGPAEVHSNDHTNDSASAPTSQSGAAVQQAGFSLDTSASASATLPAARERLPAFDSSLSVDPATASVAASNADQLLDTGDKAGVYEMLDEPPEGETSRKIKKRRVMKIGL